MSRPVVLISDYAAAGFPTGPDAVWLHAPGDAVPGCRAVTLPDFLSDPKAAVQGADLLVVCGLVSRMCRPGNRVRLGQYLTEPWWGPPRVSVDSHLFVGEPWRMWWHFGCVGQPFADCHTSYRLESHYRRYIDTGRDDPCGLDAVVRYGAGVVRWAGGFRFDDVSIHVEPMSPAAHDRYRLEKERAFGGEKTAAGLIRRLVAVAAREYPSRVLPADPFKSPILSARVTDFPVDAYLVGRLREAVALTNGAAEAFAC